MSKYQFNYVERFAVFTVHGQKCYQCGDPLTMAHVEVDHVLPERLLDDSTAFVKAIRELGLPLDFNINSYGNWMPSCRQCNLAKGTMVWWPSLLIQRVMQRADERTPRRLNVVAKIESESKSSKKIAKSFAVLECAMEGEDIADELKELLRPALRLHARERLPAHSDEPIRVTPSYVVPLYEVLSNDGSVAVVKGPFGTGIGPSFDLSSSGHCTSCGLPYFNGVRCVVCGAMDDD